MKRLFILFLCIFLNLVIHQNGFAQAIFSRTSALSTGGVPFDLNITLTQPGTVTVYYSGVASPGGVSWFMNINLLIDGVTKAQSRVGDQNTSNPALETQPVAIVFYQPTNLSAGSHTVRIDLNSATPGSGLINHSLIVVANNEPSTALAEAVANLTALINNTAAGLQSQIDSLNTRLTTAETQLADLQDPGTDQTEAITALQNQVATLQTQMDTATASLGTLQLQLDALLGQVTGNTADIAALTIQVNSLVSNLAVTQAELSSLAVTVGTLEGSLTGLTSIVNGLASQTTINTNDIAALIAQISALNTTFSSSVASLQGIVGTQQGQIDDLLARVASLEEQLAAIEVPAPGPTTVISRKSQSPDPLTLGIIGGVGAGSVGISLLLENVFFSDETQTQDQ